MVNEKLLDKFAELTVKVGVNLQKGQVLVVRCPVTTYELVRKIVHHAYLVGAKDIVINWSDAYCQKEAYMLANTEDLKVVPNWQIEQAHYLVDNKAAFISITSPYPGLMAEVDPKKVQEVSLASSKVMKFMRDHTMSNQSQWCVIAAPNPMWAKKVFPNLSEDEAIDALYSAILKASHVTLDNDPIAEWAEINKTMLSHNDKLNDYNFEALHFENSLGTDLYVPLVENHIWAGGGEVAENGVYFNPNIPTEENFCMPHCYKTSGKVVATKPLNYQGKLIENFYLEFKDGKVVNYAAEKEEAALKNLIEFDEGSSRLGEVALISYDSPINDMNILFYNTLFDENASCHLALGCAYGSTNLKDGGKYSEEELKERGSNVSMTHVDFMFGSRDMKITGITKDGKEVLVFINGNFVF